MARSEKRAGCGAPTMRIADGAPGAPGPFAKGFARLVKRAAGCAKPAKGRCANAPGAHRKASLPDLRTKYARSRVNSRSGALHSPLGKGKGEASVPRAVKE